MVKNGEHFYGELVERLAFFTMNTSPPEYVPRASAAHTSVVDLGKLGLVEKHTHQTLLCTG